MTFFTLVSRLANGRAASTPHGSGLSSVRKHKHTLRRPLQVKRFSNYRCQAESQQTRRPVRKRCECLRLWQPRIKQTSSSSFNNMLRVAIATFCGKGPSANCKKFLLPCRCVKLPERLACFESAAAVQCSSLKPLTELLICRMSLL
jgi:hypothetical protein